MFSFSWNARTIRWFLDASAYTGFHDSLALRVLPYLERGDSFCDMGCGLGRIDLTLARYLDNITAIDVDTAVLDLLKLHAMEQGFANIHCVNCDAREHDAVYDVLFMSFFGRSGIEGYLNRCRKRLIRVVNADNSGNLYPHQHRHTSKTTIAVAEQELRQAGYAYRLEECDIEFGQPLRSQAEGLLFLRHHAPDATEEELLTFLDERAAATGRPDFPLYIPNSKRIGIFIVERQGG